MKILVIHASAGAGHMKAAEAIYEGVTKHTDHQCQLFDALDYTSPFFKKLYRNSYAFLITKIPFVWGGVFSLLDQPCLQGTVRSFRRVYNAVNAQRLQQFLKSENFDYIISTHFMPTEVSAALKRAGKIRATLITVITDFDVHKIWTADGVDHYCVASSWTKKKLVSLGVADHKISASGIPTSEKFFDHPDIQELKGRLGLKENDFTVLIATGSFGIGPIEEIIRQLKDFQVIVVCGHNKLLYERLSKSADSNVKVMGLVSNMHELMAVSDVMVTKPGGLSIAEALVSQLPLIFFNAIPGQEERNVYVLNQHGIGFSGKSIQAIADELQRLKSSKDAFLTTLKKTKDLARPSAVREIISLVK